MCVCVLVYLTSLAKLISSFHLLSYRYPDDAKLEFDEFDPHDKWIDANIKDEGAIIAMMWSKFTLETTIELNKELTDFTTQTSKLACETFPELVGGGPVPVLPNPLKIACEINVSVQKTIFFTADRILRLG